MSKNNINLENIPASKFEFANTGDKIHDKKFEDKPIGYFKDAWIRFRKSRASVIAAIIILVIVLLSIIAPFAISTRDRTACPKQKIIHRHINGNKNIGINHSAHKTPSFCLNYTLRKQYFFVA